MISLKLFLKITLTSALFEFSARIDEILSSMFQVRNKVAIFCVSFQDRAHKDEKDFRRHANIQELVTLKESEKHLQQELERTKELLRLEQQNHRETIAKVIIRK